MDEDIEIIELLDENNNPVRFECLLPISYNEGHYLALHPLDDPEVDEGAVCFMQVISEGEDGESYQVVDNDILNDELFEEFMTILESIEAEGEGDDE